MRRRRTRLAVRLAASIGAGVVLTVGLAWGCSLWEQSTRPVVRFGGPVSFYPTLARACREEAPASSSILVMGPREHSGFRFYQPDPYMHALEKSTSYTDAGGWPYLALAAALNPASKAAWTLATDTEVDRVWRFRIGGRTFCLPLIPLWPGLLRDVAFYATTVFLLASVHPLWMWSRTLRCRARFRRGACPACGYDLRNSAGSTCPECGVVRAPQQ
jgi:hypothetical protein